MPLLGPDKEKAREVRVDPALMKLLTSDTRRNVLRRLGKRRMNLTELSRDVGLKKATVLEHLRRLEEAKLVTRSDDDRLWVYYELTPMARSLVDPVGTRIFLVLGVTIAALAVVATMFVFANAQLGIFSPNPGDPGAGTLGVSFHGFHDTHAGHPVDVQGAWQEADPEDGPFTAYLLDERSKTALLEGRSWQPQAILSVSATPDGLHVTGTPELDPGDYWLYISDADGNDNRQEMPRVQLRLPPIELSHTEWWRGLDAEVTIRLPSGADLHLEPDEPTPQLAMVAFAQKPDDQAIAVTNETVRLSTAMLDNKTAGTYEIHYRPPGNDRWVALEETLTIRDLTMSVVPHALVEGPSREVNILLASNDDARPDALPVVINGENVTPERWSPGRAVVEVGPIEPGEVHVQVGRLVTRSVQVLPDLEVEITLQNGPELVFEVDDAHEEPMSEVEVRLNHEILGKTDTQGRLRVEPPLAQGDGRLTFTTAQGHGVSWRTTVTGWDLFVRPQQVELGPVNSERPSLRVDVDNPEDWPINATLVGTKDGVLYAATTFSLQSHERRDIELTPAEPGVEGIGYRVQAEGPALKTPHFKNETSSGYGGPAGGGGSQPTEDESPQETETDTDVEPEPEPIFGRILSTARELSPSPTETETDPATDADDLGDHIDSDGAESDGEAPAIPIMGVLLVTLAALLLARHGGRPPRGDQE